MPSQVCLAVWFMFCLVAKHARERIAGHLDGMFALDLLLVVMGSSAGGTKWEHSESICLPCPPPWIGSTVSGDCTGCWVITGTAFNRGKQPASWLRVFVPHT